MEADFFYPMLLQKTFATNSLKVGNVPYLGLHIQYRLEENHPIW